MECQPQQSPIDLGKAGPVAVAFPPGYLDLQWFGPLQGIPEGSPGHVEFVFRNLNPRVGLRLNGKFFGLQKFHFHAPCEHQVNGKAWPLEVHLVHGVTKDGPYAVLGVMVEGVTGDEGTGEPAANEFFKEITRYVTAAEQTDGTVTIDPRTLLPNNRGDFFRYEGSLTTKINEDNPENVSWVIFREALKVDRRTLQEFIALGHKSKGLQGLYRRFVLANFTYTP